MAFIRATAGLLFVVALTALCVSNLHGVSITYSPIHESLHLPLYVVILGAFLGGFLLGSFMVWLNGLSMRRAQRKTIKTLEKEIRKNPDMSYDASVDQ